MTHSEEEEEYFCTSTGKSFLCGSAIVVLMHSSKYNASVEDPIQGSDYACEGMVVRPSGDEEYPLQVDWENGHGNQYRVSDLAIIGYKPICTVEKGNPNRTFKVQKHKAQAKKQSGAVSQSTMKVSNLITATGASVTEAKRALRSAFGSYETALEYIEQKQEIIEITHVKRKSPQTGLNQQATTESEASSNNNSGTSTPGDLSQPPNSEAPPHLNYTAGGVVHSTTESEASSSPPDDLSNITIDTNGVGVELPHLGYIGEPVPNTKKKERESAKNVYDRMDEMHGRYFGV